MIFIDLSQRPGKFPDTDYGSLKVTQRFEGEDALSNCWEIYCTIMLLCLYFSRTKCLALCLCIEVRLYKVICVLKMYFQVDSASFLALQQPDFIELQLLVLNGAYVTKKIFLKKLWGCNIFLLYCFADWYCFWHKLVLHLRICQF